MKKVEETIGSTDPPGASLRLTTID